MLAAGAAVVRGQRIDLRNADQVRNKGGTDRAAGADVIAVLLRFADELAGYHI